MITKKGLSPRFMMDGAEYKAYRTSSRLGIVIRCELVHPEDYIPAGMTVRRYRILRVISIAALPLLLWGISALCFLDRLDLRSPGSWLALFVMGTVFLADLFFVYYSHGKNFKG